MDRNDKRWAEGRSVDMSVLLSWPERSNYRERDAKGGQTSLCASRTQEMARMWEAVSALGGLHGPPASRCAEAPSHIVQCMEMKLHTAISTFQTSKCKTISVTTVSVKGGGAFTPMQSLTRWRCRVSSSWWKSSASCCPKASPPDHASTHATREVKHRQHKHQQMTSNSMKLRVIKKLLVWIIMILLDCILVICTDVYRLYPSQKPRQYIALHVIGAW